MTSAAIKGGGTN